MRKQQTTGLHGAAKSKTTIVDQARDKVKGFSELLQDLEKSITINGKSKNLYDNYSRQLAHLALHYNQFPLDLSAGQVADYMYLLKKQEDVSKAFFTFTVYAMRYACRMRGLDYEQFELPVIRHSKKLPVVLNNAEIKRLLSSHKIINRKLVIALFYECGLRIGELRSLEVRHVDLDRKILHVVDGKKHKDRYIPLGKVICKVISTHLAAFNPEKYMFENQEGTMLSGVTISKIIKSGVKTAGINKDVSAHTLRHTFATHLLERGVDIITIKNLMGHKRVETTMIYLQVVQPQDGRSLSPIDLLYQQ